MGPRAAGAPQRAHARGGRAGPAELRAGGLPAGQQPRGEVVTFHQQSSPHSLDPEQAGREEPCSPSVAARQQLGDAHAPAAALGQAAVFS